MSASERVDANRVKQGDSEITRRHNKVSKEMECSNLVPGCGFKVHAETEEELLKHVAQHAHDVHGVEEVSPELLAKVKAAIVNR